MSPCVSAKVLTTSQTTAFSFSLGDSGDHYMHRDPNWANSSSCRPCCTLLKPSMGTAHPWPGTLLWRYLRTFDLIPPITNTNTHNVIKHSPVSNIQDYFVTPHNTPGCLPVTFTGYYISDTVHALKKREGSKEARPSCWFYATIEIHFLCTYPAADALHYWKQPASSITLSRGKSMYSWFFNMAMHICMHTHVCYTHTAQRQSYVRGCEKKSLCFKGSEISPG